MKNRFLLLFLLAVCTGGIKIYAQTSDSLPSVLNPEKKAEFKGGLDAWVRFLERTLDRDMIYRSNASRGAYKVLGNFLVDSEGKVSDIRIETDPGYGSADEFKRVINLSSKKWLPATDQGKPVPFRHKQSITLIKN